MKRALGAIGCCVPSRAVIRCRSCMGWRASDGWWNWNFPGCRDTSGLYQYGSATMRTDRLRSTFTANYSTHCIRDAKVRLLPTHRDGRFNSSFLLNWSDVGANPITEFG